MNQRVPCNLAMLTDVLDAVWRHVVEFGYEKPIHVVSITDMLNHAWRGCGPNVFGHMYVQKALQELQAVQALECDWIDQSNIRVHGEPGRVNEQELHRVFEGLTGSYTNPTPYAIMEAVFVRLPRLQSYHAANDDEPTLQEEIIYLHPLAREAGIKETVTVKKVLRELRMMWVINYRIDGGAVVLTSKDPGWLSKRRYKWTFGVDAEPDQ